MKSYHIVGQALDWVLVDSKKNALWNSYHTPNADKVINYAKSIGFVSGRDWGWDAPHLQYEYKGYGTDTFGKAKPISPSKPKEDWTKKLGYNIQDQSTAYRIHTDKFKCKADAYKAEKDFVKQGYLKYAEVFGNDKDGYRLKSGKYTCQKDAELASKKMLNDKVIGYASIIGTKE